MITPQIAVFLVLAAVTVAGAVSLILQRHPIHSALSLIVVMVSLAGLYLLQGAEFVAAVQIIVYAGAIMVLFVFVDHAAQCRRGRTHQREPHGAFCGRAAGLRVPGGSGLLDRARDFAPGVSAVSEAVSTRDLSTLLFREYVFPFELTSFLILIALLGALVLARREESD